MVRFLSTRGRSEPVGLGTAVLQGLAPDGGLYVPESIPVLPQDVRQPHGRVPSFPELAVQVLSRWTDDWLTPAQFEQLAERVFTFEAPLVAPAGETDMHILELFHGPTLSFKDFGARLLGGFLGHLQQKSDQETVVLVATSGDTGSAVADGCSGIEGVKVVLLYPKRGVSPTQESQLTVRRPGVLPVRVDGSFDDCQRMVKGAFMGPLPARIRLTTANSINIARLMAQMIYYIHAGLRLMGKGVDGRAPVFCVPSGNLGNLTAGILAYRAGMPARGFIAAHNANDFFPSWLQDESARFAPSVKTLSNAMDVGAPSNFERLTYFFSHDELASLVRGERVTDEQTRGQMRITWQKNRYMADPHTAVALHAAKRADEQDGPVVVLSTAHPAKFPETVRDAIGLEPDVPEQLAAMANQPHYAMPMDVDPSGLLELIRA